MAREIINNFIDGELNKIAGGLDNKVRQAMSGGGGKSGGAGVFMLKFPENLEDFGRPYIRFRCKTRPGESAVSIHLPCPSGISFSDGASYNTIDMGLIDTIAEAAAATVNAFKNSSSKGNLEKAMEAAKVAKDRVVGEFKSVGTLGASILAARKLGADNVAASLELRGKVVQNPKTNTAFSGNTIRSFQFDFKMIGRTKSEVANIDQIQNAFRNQVYAKRLGGGNLMLKYPNQWEILFMEPYGSKELQYVPKIYSCYLISAATAVNSTSNTFRKDYSPYEVDVSLQFQETKVLTRDEIESLEANGDRESAAEEAASVLGGEFSGLQSAALEEGKKKIKDTQQSIRDFNNPDK